MQKRIYSLERLNKDVCIPTTITVPVWLKNQIAANFWNYKELLLLGAKAKENNPQMINRIRELEEANERLQKKLSGLAQKVIELGGDLNWFATPVKQKYTKKKVIWFVIKILNRYFYATYARQLLLEKIKNWVRIMIFNDLQIISEIKEIKEALAKKPDKLEKDAYERLADLEVKMAKLWSMLTEVNPITNKEKLSKFGRRFGGKAKSIF